MFVVEFVCGFVAIVFIGTINAVPINKSAMTTASILDFLKSRLLLIFAPFECNDYMIGHYIYVSIIVVKISTINRVFILLNHFFHFPGGSCSRRGGKKPEVSVQ